VGGQGEFVSRRFRLPYSIFAHPYSPPPSYPPMSGQAAEESSSFRGRGLSPLPPGTAYLNLVLHSAIAPPQVQDTPPNTAHISPGSPRAFLPILAIKVSESQSRRATNDFLPLLFPRSDRPAVLYNFPPPPHSRCFHCPYFNHFFQYTPHVNPPPPIPFPPLPVTFGEGTQTPPPPPLQHLCSPPPPSTFFFSDDQPTPPQVI